MKLSIAQITSPAFQSSIEKLNGTSGMSGKGIYRWNKIRTAWVKEAMAWNETMRALITKHTAKDESGNTLKDEQGNPKINDIPAWQKDAETARQEEIQWELLPIETHDWERAGLTPNEVGALGEILEEPKDVSKPLTLVV